MLGKYEAIFLFFFAVPPVWTLKPGELYELFEGEELRLECFASGIPRPQISWKHDGKLLANKEDFLVIREVEKNNSGNYQCDARNVGGNITAKTTVAVKGKKRLPDYQFIFGRTPRQLTRLEYT